MKLGAFMKAIYNFAADKYDNQVDFFRDFINNSVDIKEHDFINNTEKSTISKYINDRLSFSIPAKKILANPDKDNLINYLATIFHNDDQIIMLSDNLKIEENFNDVNDIADYFYNLLVSISTNNKGKDKIEKINLTKSSFAGEIMHSDPQNVMKLLNNTEDEFKLADMALNSKIPENIRKDFEYKILRNNVNISPELLMKNKDALSNHQLSFKYNFKGKDELEKFIRTIQKADILRRFIEVNPNSVERYIDDFKDEYYDTRRYKQYVGPTDRERPILTMSLTLDNGHFSQHFDNLVLKEQEIKGDTLIYTNIDDENWLFIKLSIDCSKYEEGKAKQNMNLGIKSDYATNIDYYKNYHKCDILMMDNKTHITLTDTANGNNFIDTSITNRNNYTDEDYKGMQEMFDSYDKISKIQEVTGTIFTFNPEEYNAYKPTYDVAYACVMNKDYNIKAEIIVEIIVPDENLSDYVVGDKKDRSNETDFMVLFDKKVTFKDKIIKLKDAETLEVYKKDNMNIAKVRTYEVTIEEA
ncbi:MAG: hypothetical protein IKP07_02330 [Bacilli bacterium]|nr:hypothetical protein [Bacilli bacterium]